MRVLGLDPSLTNFGWAVYDTDADPGARCEARGRFQTSGKSLFVTRYMGLRDALRGLVFKLGVTRIGVEHPIFGSDYSEGMWGVFLYTCEALRAERCDVVFFSPGQAKAHARLFLGRPTKPMWKMEKPDMVEAARFHHWGIDPSSGMLVPTGKKQRAAKDIQAEVRADAPSQVRVVGTTSFNHNEADAYWIAVTSSRFWQFLDGSLDRSELTPIERKQFTDIHTYAKGPKAGKTEQKGIAYREDERYHLWSKDTDNGEGNEGTWEEDEAGDGPAR